MVKGALATQPQGEIVQMKSVSTIITMIVKLESVSASPAIDHAHVLITFKLVSMPLLPY